MTEELIIPNQQKNLPVFWLVAGGGFLIFIDQITKALFFFRFPQVIYCNPGIAYSIVLPPIVFGLAWWFFVLALVWGLYIVIKNRLSYHLIIPLILLVSGALSNGIDRLIHDCVIDFIPIPFFKVFNLADVMIVTGAALFAFNVVIFKKSLTKN